MIRQSYFGVRCVCGCYLALEEIRPGLARCDRLDHPAWILCDTCAQYRQFSRKDLMRFSWPPQAAEVWI